MNVLTFDVALAAKLKRSWRRAGGTEYDLDLLAESDQLALIMQVLRGHAEIQLVTHVIDANKRPMESYYKISKHEEQGEITWSEAGHTVLGENEERIFVPYNGTVLEYLVEYPILIPNEWKGHKVLFLGTKYWHRSFMAKFASYYYKYLTFDSKHDCWVDGAENTVWVPQELRP